MMRNRPFNYNMAFMTATRKISAVIKRLLCLSSVVGKRENTSNGIAFELADKKRGNEVSDKSKNNVEFHLDSTKDFCPVEEAQKILNNKGYYIEGYGYSWFGHNKEEHDKNLIAYRAAKTGDAVTLYDMEKGYYTAYIGGRMEITL